MEQGTTNVIEAANPHQRERRMRGVALSSWLHRFNIFCRTPGRVLR